jgi:nicotinate dehydrogenase subunit B
MRDDDMKWSTQSAAAYADVNISLDEHGRIAAYEIDHYQPAMQDDRLIGAVLAGLPTMPAPSEKGGPINNIANGSSDMWLFRAGPGGKPWRVRHVRGPVVEGVRTAWLG